MKKTKNTLLIALTILIAVFIAYYVYLPVFNIHDQNTWIFIFGIVISVGAILLYKFGLLKNKKGLKKKKVKSVICIFLAFVFVYFIGVILSSPIVSASRFQKLLNVEERDFSKDISELSLNQIPICDKETAIILGERKMGNLANMVSQFEVSDIYTQFNYQGKPYRISPLEYASFFKWLSNHREGIPGYMSIDMTTQNTEYISLDKPIKYSYSDMLLIDI